MVLTIAPRSTFVEIYGSLMLPDPVPAELGIGQLLERNSMSQMTLLHLAAFHGQEQVVDRCLEAIHQINSSSNTEDFAKRDELMNAVTLGNDGNDNTPFLVAAAIGNECIAEKMLLFFEKDQLRGFLSQSNGFLHDAIRAAIELKRADMFRLILKTVKQVLGHDDLIVLFLSKIELNEELKSIFAACCDITACCELFKCVTEAVVQSDDLTRQKHEQQSLIELIFHDQETIDILEYMDVKFFNETISPLRNVYDWIQCLLQVDSCKGLKQLLKFFLDKFNDDQVSALVSVITQVRTSYEDNGQRSSASIWTHFVHGNLRVIDDIEKLLKRVSQLQDGWDALKNLVLHDDGNGAVIVRAFQNKDRETFDILTQFLTEEEKQEIRRFIQLRMAPHISIRVIESVPGDDSSDDEVQFL